MPESTVVVLSEREGHIKDAFQVPANADGTDSLGFFADPQVALACKEKALIETPDFKLRDDSAQMGKTRGGATRSEVSLLHTNPFVVQLRFHSRPFRHALRFQEDTSDAAYERLHRRPDNAEKKQRRMERERLMRNRQKLRDRMDQLRTADPRMLMPIVAVREQNLSPANAAHHRGGEAAMGLGKHHMSAEASANLQKIEKLRKELIAETAESLARYDAVLNTTPTQIGEKHHNEESTSVPSPASGPRVVDVVAKPKESAFIPVPKQHRPRTSASTPGQASPQLRKAKSVEAASPPATHGAHLVSSPPIAGPGVAASSTEPDIRPEHQYRNIHARTTGGRFAPRASLVDECGNPLKPARAPRPSEIARKAVKEAQRAAKAAGLSPAEIKAAGAAAAAQMSSPGARRAAVAAATAAAAAAAGGSPYGVSRSGSPVSTSSLPAVSSVSGTSTKSATSAARSLASRNTALAGRRSSASSRERSLSPTSLYSSAYDQKRQTNKVGLSLSELDAAERKPKRVRLLLGNKPGGASEYAGGSASSVLRAEELEVKPQFAAPGALSLEQAQKMMAAAMAAARGGGSLAVPSQSAEAIPAMTNNSVGATGNAPTSNGLQNPERVDESSVMATGRVAEGLHVANANVETDTDADADADCSGNISMGMDSFDASMAISESGSASRSRAAAAGASLEEGTRKSDDEISSMPARRASGRVKKLSRGAFGEKISSRALMREDFERAMQGVVKDDEESLFGQREDSTLRGVEAKAGIEKKWPQMKEARKDELIEAGNSHLDSMFINNAGAIDEQTLS